MDEGLAKPRGRRLRGVGSEEDNGRAGVCVCGGGFVLIWGRRTPSGKSAGGCGGEAPFGGWGMFARGRRERRESAALRERGGGGGGRKEEEEREAGCDCEGGHLR